MGMVKGVVVHYADHALLPPCCVGVEEMGVGEGGEKKRRKGRKSKEKGVNKIK